MNTSGQAARRSRLLLGFLVLGIFIEFTNGRALHGYEFEQTSEVLISPEFISTDLLPPHQASNRGHSYLFVNTRAQLTLDDYALEAEPELHWLQSTASLIELERGAARFPRRFLKLEWNHKASSRSEFAIGMERLNLTVRTNSGEVSVGRRPISLGVMNVFPIWNKFSRPLISDLGPLRSFSQDQINARFQRGEFAARVLDIEGRDQRDAARLAELSWYGEIAEIHVLGGQWWKTASLGLAAIKDVEGTSVKTEGVWFNNHGAQIGIGAERAFNEEWSVILEGLYLTEGYSDKFEYQIGPASRFCPLLAKGYIYGRLDYKPHPLWQIQGGDLFNAIDKSHLVHSKIIYSLTNESDMDFEIRWPMGSSRAEFSADRAPFQALSGLRWVF